MKFKKGDILVRKDNSNEMDLTLIVGVTYSTYFIEDGYTGCEDAVCIYIRIDNGLVGVSDYFIEEEYQKIGTL